MNAKEFFQATEWNTVSSDGSINSYEGAVYTIISVNEKHGSATIVDKSDRVCFRCGGAGGSHGWPGYTCFRCGGNGVDPKPGKTKLYTQARAEKLSATRIKACEKKAEEGRAFMAARNAAFDKLLADHPVLGEVQALVSAAWARKDVEENYIVPRGIHLADSIFTSLFAAGRISDRQLEVMENVLASHKALEKKKALMTHVGTEGQKMELILTAKFLRSFPSQYGTMFIQSFEDQAGNCIVYKGSAPMDFQPGETKAVKFTVKKHDEYNGQPQTVMIRPKVVA